jgi:DNA primase
VPEIDPESIEEVRRAADLVELLRGRVELVRSGGRWRARCPFHEERTPSFVLIPPENRTYYCFGCGASGDAITWMREREGAASFPEAIEALAERFNVPVRHLRSSPQEEAERIAAERRLELLERAASFYETSLWRSDEAAQARAYLAGRGFGEDLVRRFRVGYAPGGGSVLAGHAIRAGFSRDQLLAAGLAQLRGGVARDFFASRIVFPIADGRGRVQGFGARTLDPAERAKYVNSPEGPTFRKRRLLFGLSLARAEAARQGWIAVSEGYTDVMALAAAGVGAAVACMGTSLTPEQLRLLARVAGEVRLCFDADRAGEEAAWRTVEAAGDLALRLAAVPLPAGRDPGDLAGDAEGLAGLRRAVEEPVPLLEWLVRARIARAGRTAAERDRALGEVTALMRRFPDTLEKDEAVRIAASLLGLSRPLEERLREDARRERARAGGPDPVSRRLSADEERERRLLVLAVALPEAAPRYLGSMSEDAFELDEHRRAFALLASGTTADRWPEELAGLAAGLRAEAGGSAPEEAELREATYRLQERSLERRAARAREAGDVDEFLRIQELLHQLRRAIRGD